MDKEEIIKTLSFPFTNWRSLLIGGFLTLLSPLILPLFFVLGYLLELAEFTLKGKLETMPYWNNWKRLLIKGIKVSAVFIIFFVPIIVIQFLEMGESYIGMGISVVNIITFVLIYPLAIVRLAEKECIKEAFNIKLIFGKIKEKWKNYFVIWTVIIIFCYIMSLFREWIAFTIIGPAIILFYMLAVTTVLFAKMYS